MVSSSAVKLNIAAHYPKLHPVFNLSLVTPYNDPFANQF
jgi:hypothetical protein